jgi:hypothetical protein
LKALVAESRANWVSEMRQLLEAITVPKVLFWISIRHPRHEFGLENSDRLLGPFPHLVDEETIAAVRPFADAYVESISARGLPQKLYDRFTGESTYVQRPDHAKVWQNGGYPTPEMHVDAAERLAPVVAKHWGDARPLQLARTV